MQSNAITIDGYLAELPPERADAFEQILAQVRAGIDPGFVEVMDGMIGWSVPRSAYPGGYHCTPDQLVPFLGLANQKQYIALYHMGLYADPDAERWFRDKYAETGFKLDMGKSCIRFKRMNQIPFELIRELAAKITLKQYVDMYAASDPRNK